MRRIVALSVLAAVFALALPALAQQPEPSPSASAPAVTLSADQFAALVAKTTAGAPAPEQPAKTATLSQGILGMSWETIGAMVGALAALIFGLFKTAGAVKAKQMVVASAEGAWHIAERAGAIYELPGAVKLALALQAFIDAMGGSVQASQVEQAKLIWKAQSAKAGLSAPSAKDAGAAEADAAVAKAAAGGASAADLLKQAGS